MGRLDEGEILRLHRKGYRQVDIAARMGSHQPTISNIIRRHESIIKQALEGEHDVKERVLDTYLDILENGKRDQDRLKAAEMLSKMLGLNAPEQLNVKQETMAIEVKYVEARMPEFRSSPMPEAGDDDLLDG